MFKLRSVLIAIALVMLLSASNWQKSSASVEKGLPNIQGNAIQSRAPAYNLQCTGHYVPNEDRTKCICPEGRKIDWFGNCKKVDGDDDRRHDHAPACDGEQCLLPQ